MKCIQCGKNLIVDERNPAVHYSEPERLCLHCQSDNRKRSSMCETNVQPQLYEVRTGGSLANKLSNCVHDNCKDVPHDIGLKLISIVREHLV